MFYCVLQRTLRTIIVLIFKILCRVRMSLCFALGQLLEVVGKDTWGTWRASPTILLITRLIAKIRRRLTTSFLVSGLCSLKLLCTDRSAYMFYNISGLHFSCCNSSLIMSVLFYIIIIVINGLTGVERVSLNNLNYRSITAVVLWCLSMYADLYFSLYVSHWHKLVYLNHHIFSRMCWRAGRLFFTGILISMKAGSHWHVFHVQVFQKMYETFGTNASLVRWQKLTNEIYAIWWESGDIFPYFSELVKLDLKKKFWCLPCI